MGKGVREVDRTRADGEAVNCSVAECLREGWRGEPPCRHGVQWPCHQGRAVGVAGEFSTPQGFLGQGCALALGAELRAASFSRPRDFLQPRAAMQMRHQGAREGRMQRTTKGTARLSRRLEITGPRPDVAEDLQRQEDQTAEDEEAEGLGRGGRTGGAGEMGEPSRSGAGASLR